MKMKGLRRAIEDRLRKGTDLEVFQVAVLLGVSFLKDGRGGGYVNGLPKEAELDLSWLTGNGSRIMINEPHELWGSFEVDEAGRWLICE